MLLFGGAISFVGHAQNQSKTEGSGENFFLEGRRMFVRQNYLGAMDKFHLYNQEGNGEHKSDIDYYTIISRYMTGQDPARQERLIHQFLDDFPESLDRSRVMLVLGRLLVQDRSFLEASSVFEKIDDRSLNDEDLAAYLLYFAYVKLQEGDSDNGTNKDSLLATQLLEAASKNRGEMGGKALLILAAIQIEDNHFAEAERTLSLLKSRSPFVDEADAYLAEVRLHQEDYRQAADMADRLVYKRMDRKRFPQLLRVGGNAYFQMGNADRTIEYLTAYSEVVGDKISAEDAYILGVTFFNQKRYQESLHPLAIAAADRGLPGSRAALYLGQARLAEGMMSEALVAFEKAATQNKDREVKEIGMYNMAMLMRSTGQSNFGQAVRVAEGFLNEFSQSAYREQIAGILTESYYTGKDYASSLKSIEKISRPTASILAAKQFVLNRMAEQKEKAGYDKEALSFVAGSIALGNRGEYYPEAYFIRANILYRQNDFSAAASDYKAYIASAGSRDKDNLPLGYYRLGYALFNGERYDAALAAFNEYHARAGGDTKLSADVYTRIGDCRYMRRDFNAARQAYSKAYQINPSAGDYALLRRARLEGLAKQYGEQISTLDKLIREYPNSRFMTAALYERGRGALLNGQNALAEQSFQSVIGKSGNSREARQAALQLGLLYYNMGRTEDAIQAYKGIINRYSRSEEATVALSDLRSIYLEEDRIEEYTAYITSLGGKVSIAPSETEQLTFLAAERKYRRHQGDARAALESYLNRYPQGADRHKAELYLADLDYEAGEKDLAYQGYTKLVNTPDLPEDYKVDARLRLGLMQYEREKYEEAMNTYKELLSSEVAGAVHEQAVVGLAQAAFANEAYDQVLAAVDRRLNKDEISAELRLLRAKSCHALKNNKEAMADYEFLSKDFSTPEGAEALVMLAQMELDASHLSKAKSILEKFIAKSTPQQYWLARGFILLSDVYVKEGDKFTAKQYLESLQKNYPDQEDDIHLLIEKRIKHL